MTQVFSSIESLRAYLSDYRSIGLVPTMGALHQGHRSLIDRARSENDCVVVSIFVNPLQFAAGEDFDKYPRSWDLDRLLCEAAKVDAIFLPEPSEMGIADRSLTQVVPPPAMTAILCGRSRSGHFTGVATIVSKLWHIVQPQRAYFGQKDGQQLAILRQLAQDLNFPVQVVGCPIVREPSGLALSSRNQYLSEIEIAAATKLFSSLKLAASAFKAGESDLSSLITQVRDHLTQERLIEIEYVELVHPLSLQPLTYLAGDDIKDGAMLAIAVRIGTTRLIDNMLLHPQDRKPNRKPIVAIDGPAGAGKSTVARLAACELGLLYLDTGAMYRAVTWAVLQAGIDINDLDAVAEIACSCEIQLLAAASIDQPPQVSIDRHDVTREIRSPLVTGNVASIASQAAVRQVLVQKQQELGKLGGIVMEGRDIGTKVFPQAEVKIFLTATVQERAHRRQQDLLAQGEGSIDLAQIEAAIRERDHIDSTRAVSPLKKALDAIEVNTDGLSVSQVVSRIVDLYRSRLPAMTQN